MITRTHPTPRELGIPAAPPARVGWVSFGMRLYRRWDYTPGDEFVPAAVARFQAALQARATGGVS